MNSKIKVIILAGGQGKRLRPLTDDIPKCLVEVFGKSIIEHQIDCLNSCGITDITVITGYRAEKIKIPNLKYVKNVNYENTNMAYAIFLAEEVLTENVIICYGDIIFEKDVLQKIIDSNEDISVIIDKNWKELWKLRFTEPLDDAESLKLDEDGMIRDIGQNVEDIEEIEGQFIGLMKFKQNGLEDLKKFYNEFRLESEKNVNILNSNLSFECSYMTDLLRGLIKKGVKLKSVMINGGWVEIDSIKDLEIYNDLRHNNKLNNFLNL